MKNKIIEMVYIEEVDQIFEVKHYHDIYSMTVFNEDITLILKYRIPISSVSALAFYRFRERSK